MADSELVSELGKAVAAFSEGALDQLSPEARAAVAQALADGGRLCVVVDLIPFTARLVLHDGDQPPMTLVSLVTELPAAGLQ